jgi:thiamine-monophosphate kinase
MIDTSDGFLGDLGHICVESNVGAELFQEKLPVSEALLQAAQTFHKDPLDFVLGESDDYELVITCRPDNVALLRSIIAQGSLPIPLAEVGRITGDVNQISLLFPDGTRHSVKPSGWDHFRLKE